MKKLALAILALTSVGCATLTNDPMTSMALSFSDGSDGNCTLQNKRGIWEVQLPTTSLIRRSDDGLIYQCKTTDGRSTVGSIPSTIGGKIVASAVFLDFGIVDAITDKHREYPASFVIPLAKAPQPPEKSVTIASKTLNTTAAATQINVDTAVNMPTKTYPLSFWDGEWTGFRDGGISGDCGAHFETQLIASVINGSINMKYWGETSFNHTFQPSSANLQGFINKKGEVVVNKGDKYIGSHYFYLGSFNDRTQKFEGVWKHDTCEGRWHLKRG